MYIFADTTVYFRGTGEKNIAARRAREQPSAGQ